MLAYYGTRLSPHMDKTPEGYLICRDVPIARTGMQEYLAGELGLDGDPERVVPVNRRAEDVFDPAALASFEGKDVTSGHPPERVGPENHANYSRGHVQNVRREGDKVVADLLIKDAALISDVENGVMREVSCGYLCQYVPDGAGYRQTQIRGNHVAVVPRGRAGHEVAIKDQSAQAAEKPHLPPQGEDNNPTGKPAEKGRSSMSKFAEAILSAFGMAAKEAKDERELTRLVSTTMTALDAGPDKKEEPPVMEKDEEPAPPADGGQDGGAVTMDSKLDKILERLDALERKSVKDESPLRDERALDSLIEKLSGGEKPDGGAAVTIPADDGAAMDPASRDAAVTLLKKVRPAVAEIKDEAERARVVDALISSIKGPDVMGQVMQAAQANARNAADTAQAGSFEARCRESEAAYAARNPHMAQRFSAENLRPAGAAAPSGRN